MPVSATLAGFLSNINIRLITHPFSVLVVNIRASLVGILFIQPFALGIFMFNNVFFRVQKSAQISHYPEVSSRLIQKIIYSANYFLPLYFSV